jgi:hypothetical protein
VTKALLGVLGTLLTLWIIPQFSREIQDRATVRDLKEKIAEDMTVSFNEYSSAGVIRAYDLFQKKLLGQLKFTKRGTLKIGRQPSNLAVFNGAFQKWQQEANGIRARLRAYFSNDSKLESAWASFENAASSLYFLTTDTRKPKVISTFLPSFRSNVQTLNTSLSAVKGKNLVALSDKDLEALKAGQGDSKSIDSFWSTYNDVALSFHSAEYDIIARMNGAPAKGFSTRPCDVLSTSLTFEPGTLCFSGL